MNSSHLHHHSSLNSFRETRLSFHEGLATYEAATISLHLQIADSLQKLKADSEDYRGKSILITDGNELTIQTEGESSFDFVARAHRLIQEKGQDGGGHCLVCVRENGQVDVISEGGVEIQYYSPERQRLNDEYLDGLGDSDQNQFRIEAMMVVDGAVTPIMIDIHDKVSALLHPISESQETEGAAGEQTSESTAEESHETADPEETALSDASESTLREIFSSSLAQMDESLSPRLPRDRRELIKKIAQLEVEKLGNRFLDAIEDPNTPLEEILELVLDFIQSEMEIDRCFIFNLDTGIVVAGNDKGKNVLASSEWNEGEEAGDDAVVLNSMVMDIPDIQKATLGIGIDHTNFIQMPETEGPLSMNRLCLALDETRIARLFTPFDEARIQTLIALIKCKAEAMKPKQKNVNDLDGDMPPTPDGETLSSSEGEKPVDSEGSHE